MRIESVLVKNLRCIKSGDVALLPYTCFVGPNGAGKSTVLCALNIFFRNVESSPTDIAALTAEDFHLNDTSQPVEITVTFCDLPSEAIADLSNYVRQGKLIVTAEARFDPHTGKAEVKQFGQRLAIKDFARFFELFNDAGTAEELKNIFTEIESKNADIAAVRAKKTKADMHTALRNFEEAHPELCEPIRSADQFYGISGGKDRLSKYIQWIYIPAVKNASEEQTGTKQSALGKLLARTVNAQTNFSATLEAATLLSRKHQKVADPIGDPVLRVHMRRRDRSRNVSVPAAKLLFWAE